jgi:SAM-dependent methyltransferase
VHGSEGYYGELYLASVEDLLTPALSALEAGAIARLLCLRPGDRVLDAGCGHGRHLRALDGRGLRLLGVDRCAPYLLRARHLGLPGRTALVRADVRALPIRDGALAAAFSWYASLFMFDDVTNAAALEGLGRAVRPGGRVLVHHGNPLRLAEHPREHAGRTLPDGSRVEEESAYDPSRGVDRCRRRLLRPGGSRLEAVVELRYYTTSEWGPLAARAGLRLLELTHTAGAGYTPRQPPDAEAADLVAVLEKPT